MHLSHFGICLISLLWQCFLYKDVFYFAIDHSLLFCSILLCAHSTRLNDTEGIHTGIHNFCFCSIEIVQRDNSRLVITTSATCKAVINLSPFIVDILCGDEHVLSVNSRSLFRFDLGHRKSQ